ncbi:alpha/beta hydrolase [Micromonospora sp. NBC_01655]|uniref:alpha/beta fold hydrolase n=1 Tax=Micromonospora sp. NBC_01655 TaxID=2975983 RepID=UPI002250B5B0|nr:alpha/beta fold hydrolase [Micromonospora sp. NBC_01655]MCX4471790.1 alpha/beta hydrolase [Micromonospora sp. NBC_01655]
MTWNERTTGRVRAVAGLTVAGLAAVGLTGTADLAGYQRQRLDWHGCQRDSADQAGAELDRAGAACTELTVPLDYARPDGRRITVALSRLAATDPARRIGVLLLNTGGPGAPGMSDVLPVRQWMGDVGARFDLVGLDPRFVGRSTPLDCGWPSGTWTRSAGPDRAGFDRLTAFEQDLAARCARRNATLLPHVTTRNTARDMDLLRAVLGEPKLSYLGYSYGTYLGAVYTQLFPDRADRVVLDSAVDPATYGARVLRETGPANEAALRDWADWAARHHDRYRLGNTGPRVLATVDRIRAAAARSPLRVGDYRVDAQVLPFLLFNRLSDDRDETHADLAETVRVLRDAATSGGAAPTASLADTLAFALTGAQSATGSVQAAILCGDVPVPRDPEQYWREIHEYRASEPRFGELTRAISPCAFWPEPPRERPTVVRNDVPALIVQSTGDTRTLYRHGQAMHRALTGSRLLTLHDARIHGVYGNYADGCVDRAVNAYLADGVLPAADLGCTRPPVGPRG